LAVIQSTKFLLLLRYKLNARELYFRKRRRELMECSCDDFSEDILGAVGGDQIEESQQTDNSTNDYEENN
jgi:hypothetical protein